MPSGRAEYRHGQYRRPKIALNQQLGPSSATAGTKLQGVGALPVCFAPGHRGRCRRRPRKQVQRIFLFDRFQGIQEPVCLDSSVATRSFGTRLAESPEWTCSINQSSYCVLTTVFLYHRPTHAAVVSARPHPPAVPHRSPHRSQPLKIKAFTSIP